jgi:hypothetical protein
LEKFFWPPVFRKKSPKSLPIDRLYNVGGGCTRRRWEIRVDARFAWALSLDSVTAAAGA